jgi:hypothetical protein
VARALDTMQSPLTGAMRSRGSTGRHFPEGASSKTSRLVRADVRPPLG